MRRALTFVHDDCSVGLGALNIGLAVQLQMNMGVGVVRLLSYFDLTPPTGCHDLADRKLLFVGLLRCVLSVDP